MPDYYELHRRRIQLIYEQYVYWNLCSEKIKQILAALYTRYIFSAVQRNCDKRAGMNIIQRKKWIEDLYKDELFRVLIPYGKTESRLLKILLIQLKHQRIWSVLFLGRMIHLCKNRLPLFFSKIKQKR